MLRERLRKGERCALTAICRSWKLRPLNGGPRRICLGQGAAQSLSACREIRHRDEEKSPTLKARGWGTRKSESKNVGTHAPRKAAATKATATTTWLAPVPAWICGAGEVHARGRQRSIARVRGEDG
jgi:hypothetical protein